MRPQFLGNALLVKNIGNFKIYFMVSIYSQQCTENVFKIFQPLVPHIWGFYHSLWRDLTILADDFHRSLPILSKHITNPLSLWCFQGGIEGYHHFFFYQGFLSRTLKTHRTAEKGRGPSFIPLSYFHPLTNIHTFICNFAREMTITYF